MTGQLVKIVRIEAPRLSDDEALELYRGASFHQLAARATKMRSLHNYEKQVTYLVDRNINYTNVCNTSCSFCAFYRPTPQDSEAYVLSRDQIRAKLRELDLLGGTRVLLQGGHNDQLDYGYYLELVKFISGEFPRIEINAFSPSEIEQMVKVSGLSAKEILQDLIKVGLKGLPGGGAELLDDEIRQRISPKKISAQRWIEIMEIAHQLQLTTSSTMVIGFGESFENRINHLRNLRELQDRSIRQGFKGFNLFVSWSAKLNENTSLGRSRHTSSYGVTLVDYLRNMMIARIYLDNIPHHQSSWPTLGPEVAQLGLQLGCDDIGSTMLEENVVSQAGAPTKELWSISPEELRNYIVGAGFVPIERDSSFNCVRSFA